MLKLAKSVSYAQCEQQSHHPKRVLSQYEVWWQHAQSVDSTFVSIVDLLAQHKGMTPKSSTMKNNTSNSQILNQACRTLPECTHSLVLEHCNLLGSRRKYICLVVGYSVLFLSAYHLWLKLTHPCMPVLSL